jgi:hypothetical protein
MKQINFKEDRIIYDLCGGSGSWSKPYKKAGYIVRIVDIKHGQDVRNLKIPPFPIHGILAAPPCTHFAKVGNRWWSEKDADGRTLEGLSILDACIRFIYIAKPLWWCLENPSGRLSSFLDHPVMTFHPCDYGDPYRKLTCLWGKFKKPEKNPVKPIDAKSNENCIDRYIQDVCGITLTKEREESRSITPPGFAQAFFEANP